MGAHSLGHAQPQDSGYYGLWVPATGKFSNSYYQQLIQHRWYQVGIPPVVAGQPGKIQYKSPDVGADSLMLFTDVALGWTIANQCNITLAQDNCAVQPLTNTIFQSYANNNILWLQSFASAFWKLSNFGGDTLNALTGTDPGYRGPSGYAGSYLGGGSVSNGYGTGVPLRSGISSSTPSYAAPAYSNGGYGSY